jgi:hypothetical protein
VDTGACKPLLLSLMIFAGRVLEASISGAWALFGIIGTFTVFGSLRGGVDTGACNTFFLFF